MKIFTRNGYQEAPYICRDVKYNEIKAGELFVFGTEEKHATTLWVKRSGGYEAATLESVRHPDPKDIYKPVCIIHDKTGELQKIGDHGMRIRVALYGTY